MAGKYDVQVVPENMIAVLKVPNDLTEQQLQEALSDWRRMMDPQQELPFPAVPQPEQLCLKFN